MRSAKIDEKGGFGVPDMIAEVPSPGGTEQDIKVKFNRCEDFGVKKYRIVSPGEQNVVVYLRYGGMYVTENEYSGPGKIPHQTLPGSCVEREDVSS